MSVCCDQIEQSLDEAVDQVIFLYGDHRNTADALIDNVQHNVSHSAGQRLLVKYPVFGSSPK